MFMNSRALRIEWGDCDPAGIVFYPRYFEMFDTSTTVLFERALGMKKSEFLKAYDVVGYAMVATHARFRSPTRFGDDVVIETTLTELKPSSFSVQHRLMRDNIVAVEAFETRVWVGRDPDDPEKFKAKPFPSEIIERLKSK
jgi:4-hydroxybenzoyl-CoA thioesterase